MNSWLAAEHTKNARSYYWRRSHFSFKGRLGWQGPTIACVVRLCQIGSGGVSACSFSALPLNPNLPGPVNFVPFGTMRNSLFDNNLISITYLEFVYIYFSLFLNKAQTFLFAMIYDLSGYIIILTFINVIDSRLTLDILKMGWVN